MDMNVVGMGSWWESMGWDWWWDGALTADCLY